MKATLFVAIACALVCVAFAQSCSDNLDGWSAQCLNSDKTKPFCIRENLIDTNGRCTECRPSNNCDCPLDHYCSSAPGSDRGTCKELSKLGNECFPFTGGDLTDGRFPADKQCADTFFVLGTAVVDHAGACIEGVCQFCNPGNNDGGSDGCIPGSGMGPARACGYPGREYSAGLSRAWIPSFYVNDRIAVWLALFFPLMLLITLFLAVLAWSSCCKK